MCFFGNISIECTQTEEVNIRRTYCLNISPRQQESEREGDGVRKRKKIIEYLNRGQVNRTKNSDRKSLKIAKVAKNNKCDSTGTSFEKCNQCEYDATNFNCTCRLTKILHSFQFSVYKHLLCLFFASFST